MSRPLTPAQSEALATAAADAPFAIMAGEYANPSALRALVHRGLVERVGEDMYRATDAGLAAVQS